MLEETVHLDQLMPLKTEKGFLIHNGHAIAINEIIKVGRHPANQICLPDPYVSASHCQFENRPRGYFVRDLKSKNGTKLNGVSITEGLLENGSQIEVGSTTFYFQHRSQIKECSLTSQNKDWNERLGQLPHLAESGLPIFLFGESGTGKEILAKEIHRLSERRGPLVCVNCSALSESLVESELFGHTKGSFTGATTDRKGAFEAARGGTLFLDEIGELPLFLQPKLLRALENSEIKPVGSDKVITSDVRVITATHKDLERMVALNLFRQDLFFRIHVVRISIPSLRDRLEDFESLLYEFCKLFRVSFTVGAIQELKKHLWPGNIRELKNAVARFKAHFPHSQVNEDQIKEILVTQPSPPAAHKSSLRRLPLLQEMEREVIRSKLIANGYNQRRTAVDLGIPKSTLYDRIKAFNIPTKPEEV